MRASGADPDYIGKGTWDQKPYLESSPKYETFIPKDTSDLIEGDVLIIRGRFAGESGHTMLFIDIQEDHPEKYDLASASLDSRSPNLGRAYVRDYRGDYMVGRLR